MQRRTLITAAALAPLAAHAHHGWSSFDPSRPIYLEGKAAKVEWRNPHAQLQLELQADLKLPGDLAGRSVPAQSSPVEGAAILKAAQLPTRKDKVWNVELAPVSRMEAWKVAPIQAGESLAVVGYTFAGEKGEAVLRAEYLFVAGKVYGLRSSPA
ncbi:MAG TPA: DUF6152 family protein [Methylibium sp.]|uniref:DUF6152 family protein n=1 Tax=Methylibium sp. TaxID=2067992 RepID=UPI002DB643C2|nr:DUF6152 family protein [Methylibium sp.]HEU4457944.1 DUF6152 family protein [Methylibium sp.]